MEESAKAFMTGRSRAVRLPKEFRFGWHEVLIRKEGVEGLGFQPADVASPGPFSGVSSPLREHSVQDEGRFGIIGRLSRDQVEWPPVRKLPNLSKARGEAGPRVTSYRHGLVI